MPNNNQTTIAAAGITSTRFEVADKLFSCKSYHDSEGRLVAEVGSYNRGVGALLDNRGRAGREYCVTVVGDPGNDEWFNSRAVAVRRAEERVAAWIKTETETETETCDTCGGYWCHPMGLACWDPNTGPQPNEPTNIEDN